MKFLNGSRKLGLLGDVCGAGAMERQRGFDLNFAGKKEFYHYL